MISVYAFFVVLLLPLLASNYVEILKWCFNGVQFLGDSEAENFFHYANNEATQSKMQDIAVRIKETDARVADNGIANNFGSKSNAKELIHTSASTNSWYFERGISIEGLERKTKRHRDRESRSKEIKHQRMVYRDLQQSRKSDARAILSNASSQQWILPDQLKTSTRNHGCAITKPIQGDALSTFTTKEDEEVMITILGRWSRSIQLWNLKSGQQTEIITDGTDPAGYPLNDLNHVSFVLVDSVEKNGSRDIWLPCGFHGDKVNKEISAFYARIVDLDTMEVKVGPKLPFSGGACAALPMYLDGPDKPPHICTFGGSVDHHDSGVFVDKTSCYDRVRKRWTHPFGRLPIGMDHLNAAFVPKGACHPSDPARVLVLNYRTRAYAAQNKTILAFDFPDEGWSPDALEESASNPNLPGAWYVFANPDAIGKSSINYGRDAGGLLTADGGKTLLNFGGKHNKPKWAYREVRAFDVCQRGPVENKSWKAIGSVGVSTYAVQTCASSSLQIAVTCGGTGEAVQKFERNENSPYCAVNRFSDLVLDG